MALPENLQFVTTTSAGQPVTLAAIKEAVQSGEVDLTEVTQRITALESDYQTLEANYQTLESDYQTLEARVAALEAGGE